jgi:hypothetical protein
MAANYHLDNVRGFIENERRAIKLRDPASDEIDNLRIYKSVSRFTRTANEYIYELSAFLEALKSSVDLLAEVCSFYLPGVTTNYSISPLLKLIDKGKHCSILDTIAQNLDWLSTLRTYRHYLVHRLMPSAHSGYTTQRFHNKTATAYYPVVVPEKTPSFIPDTRTHRMMEEMMDDDEMGRLPGLVFGTSIGTSRGANGKEEVHEFELYVEPCEGYKLIDEFMAEHISNCHKLFQHIIQVFEALNFKPVKI